MPHDRDALLALVEKVRAAKGPDREIDFAVFRLFNTGYAGPEWQPFGAGLRHIYDGSDMRCQPPPEATPGRYTASLDAATALVERILPRWKLGTADADPTRAGLNRRAWAQVEPFLGNDDGWKIGAHEGFGATVPLAILGALLTALLAKAEAEAGGQHVG